MDLTLAEAIELHLTAMRAKRCTERSRAAFHDECAHHLADWLPRPLATLTRHEVALRHEALTIESGPYLANRVLQQFRAVYNSAARRFEDLPPTNPTIAVTFNRVRRRRDPIRWDQLATWRTKVDTIRNPVRRDLQLFLLFTGLRSHDARTVRWEHVNFSTVTLHRPKPKGGEDRAFTIPVASFVLELLTRRQRDNTQDAGWVFPSRDRHGHPTHIIEAKEQRYQAGRKVRFLPSPHRLRDTFATAAHETRLHPLDLKVLLNHALPASGDVTLGYIRPSIEHLREGVERIAAFLLERMGD